MKTSQEYSRPSSFASYFALVEASPIPMFITRTSDGKILCANTRAAETLALFPRELLGRSSFDLYNKEEDRETILGLLQEHGYVHDFEALAQRADGTQFWALISLEPVSLDGEQVLLGGFYDVTRHRQTEEALRASEERYRALFENNPTMYFTVDTEGRILAVNHFGAMQLGYSVAELLGQAVLQVFHQDDKHEILRQLQHCIRHPEDSHHWEVRKMRRDGSVLWVKESARAIRETSGRMIVLIVCEDITKRRQTEEEIRKLNQELEARILERTAALRESEENFGQLAENINAVFWMNSPAADELVYISPAYEKIWGRPASRLLERPRAFLDDVLLEDRTHMLTLLEQQKNGHPFEGEYRIVRADGGIRWIHDRGFPITNEHGEVYRFVGVAEDITKHKLADEALRASEERYRTLAESAHDLVYIIDRKGTVTYLNTSAAACFKQTSAEIIGKHLSEIFSAEEYPRLWQRVRNVFETGVATRNETEVQFPHHNLWVDNQLIPLLDEKQNIYAVMGVSRDISEHKRLEAQLRHYATGLEALVEERARQIRDLERQRIEIEKLAATGRMAARIAHEINNPLGFIQVAFKLLSREVSKNSRHYHYLDKIEKEIERIALIIRQMLDLHKPVHEAPQTFRPVETIRDVLTMMRPYTNARGLVFDLDLNKAHREVSLAENMMRQVLYNIILNAVEASPAQSKVRVVSDINENYLTITVSDSGHGIPDELQSRIFEPFFTTKTNSQSGGMGLGLSICKSLVEAMHGDIKITSVSGVGTTCEVIFPLRHESR